jgi:hypothetical protein
MQDKSGARKSIKMNDISMDLDGLDLMMLTKDQAQDINEIEEL